MAADTDSQERNKDIVRRSYAYVNAGDTSSSGDLIAADLRQLGVLSS